jgi:hypothetical protein
MSCRVRIFCQKFFVDQRRRYSVAYSKGHTAPIFCYYFFFPEALHMEGVVVETSKGGLEIESSSALFNSRK